MNEILLYLQKHGELFDIEIAQARSLIPGMVIVLGVSILATGLHWLLPPAAGKVVGIVLVAIILGLMIRNFFRLPVNW